MALKQIDIRGDLKTKVEQYAKKWKCSEYDVILRMIEEFTD